MAERCTWDNTWEGDVLDIIYGHYREALDALPLEDMPSLARRLLDAGVCFGFADPVTNIIVNTLSSCESEFEPNGAKNRKRKRKLKTNTSSISRREEVLSKIIARDGPSPPGVRTVAERSVEGLISFLVSYFPYLTRGDALRYLNLARADLLVAVNLVQKDRCYRRKDQLQVCSPAVKTALKCAAWSASQPNFDGFFTGSFALVFHINMITKTLSCCRLTVQDISFLSRLLANRGLKLKRSHNPMKLVPKRLHDPEISIENVQGQEMTESLRGVLMDRVHEHYLKAMSQFPMKDLQTHHHRGLLKAGYCFGPFHPVSNIIINTVWYDTTFPPSKVFHVDMISRLRTVETRSINGLIAFLRACFPLISDHKAMIYLLKSNLDVGKAVQLAKSEGCDVSSVCDDNGGGYKAAAEAASHPSPDAYCEFVLQKLSVVGSSVRSLLDKASRMLSPGEIIHLSTLLSSSSYVASVESTVQLTKDGLERVTKCKEDFLTKQSFVHRKIQAALQNYERSKGCNYNLGIICAVNDRVGRETGFCDTECPYTHANFWASPDNGIHTLFFAEFANDESADFAPRCYPISGLSTKGKQRRVAPTQGRNVRGQ